MAFVNLNKIYKAKRLYNRPLRTIVEFDATAKRYRLVETGLFIAKGKERQIAAANRYWNHIKAIVRSSETRTFREAQDLWANFRGRIDDFSEVELQEQRSQLFGSP